MTSTASQAIRTGRVARTTWRPTGVPVTSILKPAAFMTYARFDDQHDNGQITEFRKRLSGEVRMQTGDEFRIFQDRDDISWGENWEARINQALDSSTLLLGIITPNFFNSPYCMSELTRFESRERELNRHDLILPVYYVTAEVLDNPAKHKEHPEARIIASRQYADWRSLRFESFDSPVTRKAIEQLALRISATFR